MSRTVLFLLAATLLASCATDPVASPEDPVNEPAQVPTDTVGPSQEDGRAEPAEISLNLVNPADFARITQDELLFSALTSAGELVALDVELVSGDVVESGGGDPFSLISVSTLEVSARRVRLALEDGQAVLAVPPGLVDGESYGLRVRGLLADGRATEWLSYQTELDLRRPVPTLRPVIRTIDTTPTLGLADGYEAEAVLFSVFRNGALVADAAGRGTEASVANELSPGTYQISARALLPGGTVTRVGPWAELNLLADASPLPVWPVGHQTLGPRVGLHWDGLDGASGYQTRYRQRGETAWQNIPETTESFHSIPDLQEPGTELEWQVRARTDDQRWYAWSATSSFTVGGLQLGFEQVVAPGEQVTFIRGFSDGSRDESPEREVTLTVPFEIMRTPVTNGELVSIVEAAGAAGWMVVREDGVWTTEADPVLVVGLGTLDYGEQFGLRRNGTSLVAREGYSTHPAVGVTWYGARLLANFLSYVEGFEAAFVEREAEAYLNQSGYRLPTEAEWEYSARGGDRRTVPWEGNLSGTAANYFRSGDPFEDTREPFTGSGGPTTPVGFFDGTVREGFATRSNASAFGVFDLLGNVWQWTADRYDPDWYSDGPIVDPVGPLSGGSREGSPTAVLAVALDSDQRVVRGTAWNSRSDDVRLTNRGRYSSDGTSYSIGIRFVRSPLAP